MNKDIGKSPDFIGIGAMKAASSWISRCLSEHPEICFASQKGVHFFNTPILYKKGLEYYESFFKDCQKEKVKGEFSPKYMYEEETAVRIYKHYPNVKLIACLRNPVDRAVSHYRFGLARQGRLSFYKDFRESIDRDDELVPRGMYYEQLKRFFDIFPPENILVVLYDDLKKDPLEFIQKIYQFLGVKNDFVPGEISQRTNKTGAKILKPRIVFINNFLYRTRNKINTRSGMGKILYRTKMFSVGKRFIDWNKRSSRKNKKYSPDLEIKNEDKEYLKQIYRQDIENLEKLINKDLSIWK